MMNIIDMPKLESPFVREIINGQYILTPKITPGYEWVFSDEEVVCMEKLNGTNVSIIITEGTVTAIFNRTARVPFINKGKEWITKGVLESYVRGMCELPDGQHFGELIGKKIQGNPHKIEGHLWIPFNSYGMKHLVYK